MSQQNDSQNPGDSIESLKVTAAAKREHGDPVEKNEPIPGWLLLIFGAVICFSGVYFGIYHGGFQGNVFNEEQSSPEILFAQKGGGAAQAEVAVEQTLVELGKGVYANCQPCHQASGLGIAGQFPTLAGTDWVNGSEKRLVAILLKGLMGPIKVGDATYNGAMPAWEKALSDKKLAAVMSYVRASFGNNSPEISEAKVAAARKEFAAQVAPWTEADLLKIPADAKIEAAEPPAPAAGGAASPAPTGGAAPASASIDLEAGKSQYLGLCGACHQPTGLGLPPVFPPLVNSEYLSGSTERLIAIVLKGVIGPITVDGKPYNNIMPPQGAVLTDSKISQITSYARDAFGGKASPITPEEVAAVRKKYEARQASWTEAELKAFAP